MMVQSSGKQPRSIPKHSGWPVLGNVVPFIRDLLYYPDVLRRQYGDVFCMAIPQYDPIFLFDPVGIQYILEKNHQNYKKSRDYDVLKVSLGEGLLTSDGPHWKAMRKHIQPYFYPLAMDHFLNTMNRHAALLVADWATRLKPIVLNQEMKHVTLKIASETFFGVDIDSFPIHLPTLVDRINHLTTLKNRFPRNMISWKVPIPLHRQLKRDVASVDAIILDLLENPPQDYSSGNLLTLLLNSQNLSHTQIRDEIVTFLTAGYETTANSMMFTLALLAAHPGIQNDLIHEIRSTPLRMDDYKKWKTQFSLLYAVIQESLRLYPPAWMLGRQARVPDEVAGYEIPANRTILIDIFLMHRHPQFWKDPSKFEPNRFLATENTIEKGVYLPFGGGNRVCVGQHFAMLEMVVILHHIFSTFQLNPIQTDITLSPLISLTPQKPLIVEPIPVRHAL